MCIRDRFYNGTPLRLLGQEGDWTRVALGLNGPEGWMMTRYLAFGGEMDEVEPVFPPLMYVLAVSYTHLDVYKRQVAGGR